MVAIMVIDAPPILLIISTMSPRDTTPINKMTKAPIDAGQASLIPFGLQKMIDIVMMNTKIVIPIWKIIIIHSPFSTNMIKLSIYDYFLICIFVHLV